MNEESKKSKVSDFESFARNPFQGGLKPALKFGWRRIDPDKARAMVDADSGETVFLSDHGNVKLLLKDITEFTKLYGPALTQIHKLSTPGIRMLTYICTLIKKDTDWIKIEPSMAMEWCGYDSRTPVYTGLCSLLEHSFVCRKTGGNMEYYINVTYFFNGKRSNLDFGSELKERVLGEVKKGRKIDNLQEFTDDTES